MDGGKSFHKKTKIKDAKVSAVANFLDGSSGGWDMGHGEEYNEESSRHGKQNKAYGSVRKVIAVNNFGRKSKEEYIEESPRHGKQNRAYGSVRKVIAVIHFQKIHQKNSYYVCKVFLFLIPLIVEL